jgi:PAS domain S-box-containing protein
MGEVAQIESRGGEIDYRDLFTKIREGFFVGEIVRDRQGTPADFLFLEANQAFTDQTGIAAEHAIGRRVSQVIPGFPRDIVQRYGDVVDTGETVAFEVEVPALGNRVYEARAHPLGGDRFAVLFLEITRRKRVERALEENRALLADIVDTVDDIVWSAHPDGHHDFFNRRWYEITGASPGSTDGEDWIGWFHPDDRERTIQRWQHSLRTGEPYEIEYRVRHHSGAYHWLLARAHPVRDAEGRIIRWMGTCTDIQAQKSAAEQLELASNELSHRIKNIFAIIAGLINLGARAHPQARPFVAEMQERIIALGQAHDYARPHSKASAPEKPASLLGLIRELLTPYALDGRERFVADGEDAPLRPSAITPIALAIHELATNAAKYGAFSVPDGQVRIRTEHNGPHFTLHWTERGGPPPTKPNRTGFGSQLIEASRQQLGGEIRHEWAPEGLEVSLSMPFDRITAAA